MEILFGFVGKDYALTASDNTAARSIVVQKRGEDKSRILSKHTLLSYNGEAGDTCQFSDYIAANIKLYEIKNGVALSTAACTKFTRRELANSLRSRNAYQVNLLISGSDPKTGVPSLFWLDHLASANKVNYTAHGYASYFILSTMDLYWHENLTLEEGLGLVKKCLKELKIRFIGNLPDFFIKVVDKNGIREIKL
ncbi:Proteasome subunit beta type-4 [Clydaea vesicula]|uniref:Proteasome subunit beta n=1 Tax=Clydaea vesicula TaxID=447962 RepID=A0AAD5U7A0_9FUNG|nr:Proteasome subunit beta type-4 [Clydaea vesicula]KAJ3379162.1 Proteasome subunit beta type-4 [Lobulomyces angularis]